MNSKWKILKTALKQYKLYKNFTRLSDEKKATSQIPAQFVSDILGLGPAFIKLGQIMSTRPDILPVQYITALEELQEHVPAFDFKVLKQIVEEELGEPITQLFQIFEQLPVASASLSQVHLAILHSGENIAVKVQRPGIKTKVLNDLKLLEEILKIFNLFFPKIVKRTNLQEGFREFKRYTIQELDFAHEGETVERFQSNFKDWNDIIFPKIYWKYTTEKVLTMGQVSGLRLKEAVQKLPKEARELINIRLAEMELKMFISDGLFHADLHPGNIFFKEDGKIVLLDFGMYGELTMEERDHFVLYWLAVVQNQVKRAFYHFKKQCTELPNADENSFYEVFRTIANEFYRSRLIDTSITKVYLSMISAGYKYGYVFPANLLLHAKALTTAEALTFDLAPDTRFEEVTKPIIAKEFARLTLDGKRIRSRMEQSLPEFLLTGEMILASQGQSANEKDTHFIWEAFYNMVLENLRNWEANAGAFQSLLNRPVREVLRNEMGNEAIDRLIKNAWDEFAKLEGDLPKQQTLGATITIHLAAATLAFYNTLLKAGKTKEEATDLLYKTGWKIYKRMGEAPMLIAGIFSDNPHKRMELATQIFRMFPFTAPDYGWAEVETDKNTVAFNCTRCHVAELFMKFGLGDVCYNTFCKLDFPLAQQWGGKLTRTGSIAGGADKCDFRWITGTTE